ncbi:MAG: ATP-binding cassette domain-containing protein, partial [Lachnospiraceae bacterium]|nr:ATP-binding cassette domain-containing protein [Lachnospiraceae bacterium]
MKKIIEPCGLHCIKMRHLGVRIGEQVILEDVNMHIHCGTLTAIIGRNGAGKTTLIRAILDDIPHEGQIDFRDTEN